MTALPQARSQARMQARSQVGGAVGGGGAPGYDADAQDYFTRAEALGGSFDLSGINATYTESYVKTAISNFVAGCKTDAIWTKITEAYLLSGVTFSGVLAKLKHAGTAALTNVNFVSGDYLAAGSGAGLAGNGSTKFLDTDFVASTLATNSTAHGAYTTVLGTGYSQSAYAGGFFGALMPFSDGNIYSDQYNDSGGRLTVSSNQVGMYVCSRTSASSHKIYRNGTEIASNATSGGTLAGTDFFLFRWSFITGTGRASFSFLSSGLNDTESANLSTRVNALMTALGANVY